MQKTFYVQLILQKMLQTGFVMVNLTFFFCHISASLSSFNVKY